MYSEKSGKCDKVAGPPRVGARHSENVIWRVYNRCGKQQTIRIDGFTFSEKDAGVPPADEDNYRMQQDRSAAPGKTADDLHDPFEPGNRSVPAARYPSRATVFGSPPTKITSPQWSRPCAPQYHM